MCEYEPFLRTVTRVGLGSWLFAGGATSVEERAIQAVEAVAAARTDGHGSR